VPEDDTWEFTTDSVSTCADDKIIQEGSGEYMEPTATDNFYAAVQQRAAITNSRRAFNDALLAPLIGG
jgi:hypothetical protein